jgi:hypothetical protein
MPPQREQGVSNGTKSTSSMTRTENPTSSPNPTDLRKNQICERIINIMSNQTNQGRDGLNANTIRHEIGEDISIEELCNALDFLMDNGLIFTTIDEDDTASLALPTPPNMPVKWEERNQN